MAAVGSSTPSHSTQTMDLQEKEESPCDSTTGLIVRLFGFALASGVLLAPFYHGYPVSTILVGATISVVYCYTLYLIIEIRELEELRAKYK